MSRLQGLKLFVNQRLNAAVEEIFGHFERTIIEYEEEMDHRHRKLLHVVSTREIKLRHAESPADVHQLLESQVEVPPEQQEWSSSLDQEDPEPPHIKEEQEELWTSQEGEQLQGLEEADITKFPFSPVPVKSEYDEKKPQSSQLHQSPTEENREAEPLTSSSTQHMETEADGDECGGSEPASNSDPLLQPDTDEETSDSSETDVSDDVCELARKPQSGLSRVLAGAVGCRTVEGSFICSECGQRFGRKSHLNAHMRIHLGEKPFSCSVCSKRFRKRSDLVVHFRIHTGEKPFSCSVCNTSFTKRTTLVQHMRTHTGVKPYICSVCGKMFSQKGHMTTHTRTHTGVKPFPCSICGKMFSEKGHMRRHMAAHTGVKPFSCSVCGKMFSQKGHMRTHMAAHTGEKPFSCSVCDERFTWRSQLKRHKCAGENSSSK